MKTSTKIILGIVVLSAISAAFFIGRSVGKKSVKAPLPAPTPLITKQPLEMVKPSVNESLIQTATVLD